MVNRFCLLEQQRAQEDHQMMEIIEDGGIRAWQHEDISKVQFKYAALKALHNSILAINVLLLNLFVLIKKLF